MGENKGVTCRFQRSPLCAGASLAQRARQLHLHPSVRRQVDCISGMLASEAQGDCGGIGDPTIAGQGAPSQLGEPRRQCIVQPAQKNGLLGAAMAVDGDGELHMVKEAPESRCQLRIVAGTGTVQPEVAPRKAPGADIETRSGFTRHDPGKRLRARLDPAAMERQDSHRPGEVNELARARRETRRDWSLFSACLGSHRQILISVLLVDPLRLIHPAVPVSEKRP